MVIYNKVDINCFCFQLTMISSLVIDYNSFISSESFLKIVEFHESFCLFWLFWYGCSSIKLYRYMFKRTCSEWINCIKLQIFGCFLTIELGNEGYKLKYTNIFSIMIWNKMEQKYLPSNVLLVRWSTLWKSHFNRNNSIHPLVLDVK
jgi:hypothetical protein